MNLSKIFIHRRVMTSLVMLATLGFGILAYRDLAISDLPNVEPKSVGVIGFCMGGRLSLNAASTGDERIGAAVAFYGGVQPTKGTSVQVTDTCGMLEAYGQVDKALADLNGNTMAFRASEDRAHIEGISEQIASALFYGNEVTLPESFTGLAPRYSTVQTSTPSSFNVIDFGGTGSVNTSIWLVVWGPRTIHGIIPKGSTAGLQARDLGEQIIQNSDGSKYQAYMSHYRFDAGLCVRDWRYAVRIANVDTSSAGSGVGVLANTPNIVNAMIQALEHIPQLGAGRPVFYMNRFVRQQLRLGIAQKTITQLTMDEVAGRHVMMFDTVPVRRVDELISTEARVT